MPADESVSVIPTKIVVPIDFSASSHLALDAATELAAKFGAELFLLHVIPQHPAVALPAGVTAETIISEAKKAAEEHFEVSLAGLKNKGVKATSSVQIDDDIAGGILDAIENVNADLIVFTTHGVSGWYPQVFGSVAEKLVRLSPCPTLLLRTPKPARSAKVTYAGMMEWW